MSGGLTGTHVSGETGEISDNNLRDIAITTNTAAIIFEAATARTNEATYLRLWRPVTPYLASEMAVNPTGQIVAALTDHTSGPTYDPSFWGGPATPVFTASTPPGATAGTAYSYTFTATGFPAPTFAVTTGSLPAGLTLTSAGVLSGTPTTSGTVTFTVTASSGLSPSATASCSIVVASGTAAPVFTASSPPAATVGTVYSYTFTASGSPAPTFAVTTGSVPAGLTLTTAGVLSGTPTTAASVTFTVTASNGIGSPATTSPTIVVSAPSGATPAWVGYAGGVITGGWQVDTGQYTNSSDLSIVSTPARTGNTYPIAKFICAPGDYTNGGTTAERTEVRASDADSGNAVPGQTMWWAFSMYVPTGFQVDSNAASPVGNGWLVCTQWHSDSSGGSPNVAFGFDKGYANPLLLISALGDGGQTNWTAPFTQGQWNDLVVGVTWHTSSATGRLTVKLNGTAVVNNAACSNLYSGYGVYLKQGMYRSASARTDTIYYTGTRRGTTEASVAL